MKIHMLKKLVFLWLCALGAGTAQADILSPGMFSKDTIGQVGSMETKGGFSAQFWMTTDEQIFTTWAKSSAIRNLKPNIEVKRNTPIFLALFMANPGIRNAAKQGEPPRPVSNVTFDLYVINPAGTLTLADKQRMGWRGTAPSPGLVYLAKDRGVVSFEAIDPAGEYTIAVIIHDNVRKVDIKLMRKLQLLE